MIPRFVMSDRMKEIGRWTFNAWALDGYQKVFWYQSPVSSLRTEVSVLLGSAFGPWCADVDIFPSLEARVILRVSS